MKEREESREVKQDDRSQIRGSSEQQSRER
jgi:hypothetical protein